METRAQGPVQLRLDAGTSAGPAAYMLPMVMGPPSRQGLPALFLHQGPQQAGQLQQTTCTRQGHLAGAQHCLPPEMAHLAPSPRTQGLPAWPPSSRNSEALPPLGACCLSGPTLTGLHSRGEEGQMVDKEERG